MTCQYVISSNLLQVCYDPPSASLDITFRSGGVYRYSNVPTHVHAGLMSASSHGDYFHQHIKDKYPCRRIR